MINDKEINSEIKPNFWKNIKHTSNFVLLFFGAIIIIKASYDIAEGAKIFGDKNVSFFDVWSLEHIITGMSLSYFFLLFRGPFVRAMNKDNEKEIARMKKDDSYTPEMVEKMSKILERKTNKNKIIHHSLIVIAIALAWEILELYMETAVFKTIGIESYFATAQQWFSGVELFLNRFFVDVALVYLGWYFVRHRPVLSVVAAPVSLAWLMIHILVFRDSMYMHKHSLGEIAQKLVSFDMLYVAGIVLIISLSMNAFKAHLKKSDLAAATK